MTRGRKKKYTRMQILKSMTDKPEYASQVAEKAGCSTRTAKRRLQELYESTEIQGQKTSAGWVYWL